MSTSVLIVDDHSSFRTAARRVLERHGFDVVGEAGDGEAALRAARELRPDVVLLDVQMPGMSGFEVARRLSPGGPAVVIVSSRDGDDFDGLIAQSGARAFIPKDELSGPALDAALSGCR